MQQTRRDSQLVCQTMMCPQFSGIGSRYTIEHDFALHLNEKLSQRQVLNINHHKPQQRKKVSTDQQDGCCEWFYHALPLNVAFNVMAARLVLLVGVFSDGALSDSRHRIEAKRFPTCLGTSPRWLFLLGEGHAPCLRGCQRLMK